MTTEGEGTDPPKRKAKRKARRKKAAAPIPPKVDETRPEEESSLTPGDYRDLGLVRRAVVEGWELQGEDLQRAMQLLRESEAISRVDKDARGMRSSVDLYVRIARMVQDEEHFQAKMANGTPDQTIQVNVTYEDRSRRLPDGDD